ncbi:MAG TPA: hypothetical protein DCM58_04510 [Desulfovibrio sp.]|nr:hypothetical protein [Desulfovibrio sp.]
MSFPVSARIHLRPFPDSYRIQACSAVSSDFARPDISLHPASDSVPQRTPVVSGCDVPAVRAVPGFFTNQNTYDWHTEKARQEGSLCCRAEKA